MHVVVFRLDAQQFAVPASCVERIVAIVAIEEVAGAPAVIDGIINAHGRLLPVYGLRQRLGLPRPPAQLWEHLIIARAGSHSVALRVDRAMNVTELSSSDVEPIQSVTPATRGLGGVARTATGVLLIHDLDTFLDRGEAAALGRALDARRTAVPSD